MQAANTPASLLTPGAALNRFVPPEGVSFVTPDAQIERVRYGFRIGSLGLLINADTSSEAIPMPAIFSIPNAAPWLRGMINLRGNLAPIFDLATLLTLPRNAKGQALVLILDKGPKAVGMIIDDLPEAVTQLQRMSNLPPLPASLEKYVSIGYTANSSIWLEFDHERFFQSLVSLG